MSGFALSRDEVLEMLNYDPETGVFTRRLAKGPAKVGDIAGSKDSYGYVQIRLRSKIYLAHRLAWLVTYGYWPENQLDHINRDRADNRVSNLREATHAQNLQNRAVQRNNKSGFIGVSWYPKYSKWMACIGINGKSKTLGYFDSPEAAGAAYAAAKAEMHEFHGAVAA